MITGGDRLSANDRLKASYDRILAASLGRSALLHLLVVVSSPAIFLDPGLSEYRDRLGREVILCGALSLVDSIPLPPLAGIDSTAAPAPPVEVEEWPNNPPANAESLLKAVRERR